MIERRTCVVVGGGPAGMVVSLLLARAGVEVTVLEKHGDFLRDFRGDTVHPSTMELLDELGLGERFNRLPQSRLTRIAFPVVGGRLIVVGDLGRLKVRYPYIAMVPQWDLLDLLADAAREEPSFSLRMRCEVTGLIREDGRVRGVEYRTADGSTNAIHADLVIGCDGRWSIIRQQADLRPREYSVSIDDVKHLDVRLNRLDPWHIDGLLCIGDAAHAMSPVGGVGINLAVQDAVAAATLLAEPLRQGTITQETLARVRSRRLLPTILVQELQHLMHEVVVEPIIEERRMGPPKPVLALLKLVPQVSYLPAYLIGVGFRPEHAPAFARRQPVR